MSHRLQFGGCFAPNPWDIHCYWRDHNEHEAAMELRSRIQKKFPWLPMHRGGVCHQPCGPHSAPMWDCDFGAPDTADRVDEVVAFIQKEGSGLSVLVHPNTKDGCLADHTTHAKWIGQPLPIKMYNNSILPHEIDKIKRVRATRLTATPNMWGDSSAMPFAASSPA